MNRSLSLVLSVAMGVVLGAAFSRQPAMAARSTLYGTVSDRNLNGVVPITVELRDPMSDEIVVMREAQAKVSDGRYLADLGEGIPSGLYVLNMASPAGVPLQVATFVELQASTPGAKQTGNANISGTLLAGKIGVPSVNSGSMINAQATPGLIGVRGQSDTTGVVGASSSGTGTGVSGVATSTTGTAVGVNGTSASPTGVGVRGRGAGVGVVAETTSTTEPALIATAIGGGGRFSASGLGAYGVSGTASGTKGAGVKGEGEFGVQGNGLSGPAIGVLGGGKTGVAGIGEEVGGLFEALIAESTSISAVNSQELGFGIRSEASGNNGTAVFGSGSRAGGEFFANGLASVAVRGANLGTGIAFGGDFSTSSPDGRGVRGRATSTSGPTFGGWFTSLSPEGTGAIGTVNSTNGPTIGLHGTVNSSTGKGVFGEATSLIGVNFGGDFVSNSDKGAGLRARNTSATGFTVGASLSAASPNGTALVATNTATTGAPGVIRATLSAPGGTVGQFESSATTGIANGARILVSSPNATAVVAQNLGLSSNVVIGSKNGAVMYDKGHINKKFGNSLFSMTPIAYGVVKADGTKAGGTNNWTVSQNATTKVYFISLTGEQLTEDNFVVNLTQFGNSISDTRLMPLNRFDSQDPFTVGVSWATTGGTFASTKFHFVIYGQVPTPTEPPPAP